MISKWDEYFIHQSYETIQESAVAEELYETIQEPTVAKERLYLGCHSEDGTAHLAIGLGVYPEKKLMDAFVCARLGNTQYNLRLARPVDGDFNDLQIGPLRIEIVEPLQHWRVQLDDNDFGISCSLDFEGLDAPYLARLKTTEFLQYNQPGRYTGHMTIGGEHIDATGFTGARDRSWRAELPRSIVSPFGGHFWMLAHFDESWLFVHGFPIWEVDSPPDFDGAISDYNGNAKPISNLLHRVTFQPGARSVKEAEIQLVHANGDTRHLLVRPRSAPISFAGAGYEMAQDDGDSLSMAGEQWDLRGFADIGSERFGPMGMGQHVAEFELDGKPGVGILEMSYSPEKDREYKPTW